MYLEIKIPKDISSRQMEDLYNLIDPYVINFEIDLNKWLVKLFTIPININKIREIVSNQAKIYSKFKKDKQL